MWNDGKCKVLLKEVEQCRVCHKKFLSLYPISKCENHEGFEELKPKTLEEVEG